MDKLKLLRILLEDDAPISGDLPRTVGDKLFAKTVTRYSTGRVKRICGKFFNPTRRCLDCGHRPIYASYPVRPSVHGKLYTEDLW